jgi:hypothetical protein
MLDLAAWMPTEERLDGFLQAEKSKSAEAIDAEALDKSLRFGPRLLSAKEVCRCFEARETGRRLPRLEQQSAAGAGQIVSMRLFPRGAGVHVDFHAHRHFDNLRSFPAHWALPSRLARRSRQP